MEVAGTAGELQRDQGDWRLVWAWIIQCLVSAGDAGAWAGSGDEAVCQGRGPLCAHCDPGGLWGAAVSWPINQRAHTPTHQKPRKVMWNDMKYKVILVICFFLVPCFYCKQYCIVNWLIIFQMKWPLAHKMTTEQHYNPQNPPKTCPQCQKKGAKRKVKSFYINLDEEVRNGRKT